VNLAKKKKKKKKNKKKLKKKKKKKKKKKTKGDKNLRSKPGGLKTSDEQLWNVDSVADGEELIGKLWDEEARIKKFMKCKWQKTRIYRP